MKKEKYTINDFVYWLEKYADETGYSYKELIQYILQTLANFE